MARTLYEVNIEIERDLIDEYDPWLKAHVAEMLALPGFESAEIFAVDSAQAVPESVGRVVHYRLSSRQALDDYIQRHARTMRGQGTQRFADRVRIRRRVLELIDAGKR